MVQEFLLKTLKNKLETSRAEWDNSSLCGAKEILGYGNT